jgi:hypothetical protein
LLHLKKDRDRLIRELRAWQTRNGHTAKFAQLSFQAKRLRQDVVRESFALYKVGLRLNRLFLFLAIGFLRNIPFATHDWHILGDHRDGEDSEHCGIKMLFSFSAPKRTRRKNRNETRCVQPL